MKVSLSGESRRFNMYELGDEEFFQYLNNHPNPELMGGKLKDAWKRGTKKVKAKVQKAVKKAVKSYKKLPKWAQIATGALAAPAVLGLAPAAIGAVAPLAATGLAVGTTTAASALPAALPALQARKISKTIAKKRAARLAQQAKVAAPAPAAAVEQATEQIQAVAPQVQQPIYSTPQYQDYQDYEEQEPQQRVTSSNIQEEKKGIPGWLLGAAALIPFFL